MTVDDPIFDEDDFIKDFRISCIKLEPFEVVDRYLIEKSSYFFENIIKGGEYEFKKEIAQLLKVHIRDIVIVGSGKLGFSLKPDKINNTLYPFTLFDGREGKKSDLDIAIISSSLFDREMQNLYDHTNLTTIKWKNYDKNNFTYFMLRGRLTIRNLPKEFQFTKDVWNVQEKYRMQYGRVINFEIYKSWHYFESYHQQNIFGIQLNLLASS